jgi:hypothetical protein
MLQDWYLKQEGDAICKAVHIDAGLDVPSSHAHCSLNNKGVALQHARIACMT